MFLSVPYDRVVTITNTSISGNPVMIPVSANYQLITNNVTVPGVPANVEARIYVRNTGTSYVYVDDLAATKTDNSAPAFSYYSADVKETHDYYPFGAPMPGRSYSAGDYRYGFNGSEKNDEVKGNGNSYEFTFRVYDSRLGRFLSVDPIGRNYPHATPYGFAENSPIQCKDLEGLEKYKVTGRSFIPMAALDNPPYSPNFTSASFAGDNRTSYQLNTTAYRTEQTVNVDFDKKSVSYSSNTASGSSGLNKAGKVVEASEASKSGPVPTFNKTFLENGKSVTIHMEVNASNKLVSGAPAINYQFDVTITPSADKKSFTYQIKGSTDGFPAYEFWITDETNNKSFLLFNRTPTESGEGPGSLFPPMEHDFNLKGNSVDHKSATEVKFGETQNSSEYDVDACQY